jgi:glycosyltransferase involved in cell wall biosynthesis
MIHVTQFIRYPTPSAFSIERLYQDVRSHLAGDIKVMTCFNRFRSHGVLRRFYDIVRARRKQGHINHVTGDVHFVTYLLDQKRTILTIHDCELLERSHGIKYWLLWFFWFWLAEKCCRVIVAISEETKNQILLYINCNPEKIIVIHNPVSNDFQPFLKPFNQQKPRLLQIGTKTNKNIERLIQALSGINSTLVIVGQLSRKQISMLNQNSVSYENHISLSDKEIVEQYQNCDLLTFVSTSEGFGLPIVEAQAVGRPVITSCISSMPEIAGDAACFVDPFDIASIRAGIIKVINDVYYRQKLVYSGWQNVQQYRIIKVAEKYACLYRSLSAL